MINIRDVWKNYHAYIDITHTTNDLEQTIESMILITRVSQCSNMLIYWVFTEILVLTTIFFGKVCFFYFIVGEESTSEDWCIEITSWISDIGYPWMGINILKDNIIGIIN